jgi:hypothetical protein
MAPKVHKEKEIDNRMEGANKWRGAIDQSAAGKKEITESTKKKVETCNSLAFSIFRSSCLEFNKIHIIKNEEMRLKEIRTK